ncbi:hypothetical protein IGI04_007342 [Brassica rapa subsp. trilocularis]|uniref:Uncharacterized protein n=1 Tax=Brassica rapa subsp. trilocularis TaxID=1813537 RepID=A0ABQ7NJF7_BRACM|nr:hypothetical protein IGI04_007342 [Brassica rapa subsp. trilocularis]
MLHTAPNVDKRKLFQVIEKSSSSPHRALSTCIGSGASSECVLVVSGGLAEGFGCGLSALIHAMLIFGNCTRNVRGAYRSMGAGGLGGCGCLAANSSCVMILTALHGVADYVGVVDGCSGKLVERFWLKFVNRSSHASPLARNHHL